MLAVKTVGPFEWDDFGQPLWAVTADTSFPVFPPAGRYHNISLLSDFDVVVSEVHSILFEASGAPSNSNLTIGVPPSTYDVFEFPGFIFRPGFRPSFTRFNAFNTALSTSEASTPNPLSAELGWNSPNIDVNTWVNVGSVPVAQSTRQTTSLRFRWDPPLIIPGGLIVVFQPGFVDVAHRTTVWFREQPTSTPIEDRP